MISTSSACQSSKTDQWWSAGRNPHADLQAMDRCHRIGQQRPVLVFRLATGNSIEVRLPDPHSSEAMETVMRHCTAVRITLRRGREAGACHAAL